MTALLPTLAIARRPATFTAAALLAGYFWVPAKTRPPVLEEPLKLRLERSLAIEGR